MNFFQKYKTLFKEKIATFLYQKILKQNERRVNQHGHIKTVGILFDLAKEKKDIHKKIIKITEELHIDRQKVTILAYIPKIDEGKQFYSFYHFSEEDLNWFYQPKSKRLKKFVSESFDLLINLSDSLNYPMKLVTAYSKAKFKIGRHISEELTPYDFSVKMKHGDTTESFIKEIEYYLKNVFKI